MPLTEAQRTFLEGSTHPYSFTIKDENGNAIALASIDTVALDLYSESDGDVINSRTAQNIKNTNNVTIHATSGLITWSIQAADNAINGLVDHNGVTKTTLQFGWLEKHVAEFTITLTDSQVLKRKLVLLVENLRKTT